MPLSHVDYQRLSIIQAEFESALPSFFSPGVLPFKPLYQVSAHDIPFKTSEHFIKTSGARIFTNSRMTRFSIVLFSSLFYIIFTFSFIP